MAFAPVASPSSFGGYRVKPYQRFDPAHVVGRMTVEEWDIFDWHSKEKHHFVYGDVVQMAGATTVHNLLAMNTAVRVATELQRGSSDCEVLGSDQRVYVTENLYYYPDLVVICGTGDADVRNAVHHVAALMEVLSSSPEQDDRTDKFREFQMIPSLQHYVLIAQDRVAVTHFQKIAGGLWAIAGDYRDLGDALRMTLGETTVTIPLAAMYRRVSFAETPSGSEIASN